jgi:predicted RNA-binding protein with PIN domain
MGSGRSAAGAVALIDGYNVIMQHDAWSRLPLATARQRLVMAVARVPWPEPVARVDVVFDGPASDGPLPSGQPGISITFATPEADTLIQAKIRHAAGRLVVISDDREIVGTAKSHGVRCYAVAWLLERLAPAQPRGGPPVGGPSETDRRRITDELTRRWKL